MNTKYFLGLTFYPDNAFSKLIESFRTRFDPKYQTNSELYLPIVPPFEVEVTETKKLKQELVEELESFFFENTANHSLNFSGMDVHQYKKNSMLYLNPVMDEEFLLCQESVFDICQSYISDREKKMKDASKKTFLTIGRYTDPVELHNSIEMARTEFQEFTALAYKSICLYSKNNGIWYREADLVSFEKPDLALLQTNPASI
jgi:hypothetical protein